MEHIVNYGDMWMFMQIKKEVLFLLTWLFILLLNKQNILHLFESSLLIDSLKIRYNTSDSGSFNGQGHYIIK